MKYVRIETVEMKGHPELNEGWVQKQIAEDPKILGLGDLRLISRERKQLAGGRLDLLLLDPESEKRYEVEVQLGTTDPAHIIRTIEYWDVEQRRSHEFEHCAVIVAEDVTSRFLNVISLFNGHIPLIALRMTAIKADGGVGLLFTKVVCESDTGPDGGGEGPAEGANRADWEKWSSKHVLELADRVLLLLREIDSALSLNYTSNYIGLAKDDIAKTFIWLTPMKSYLRLNVTLPKDDETSAELEGSGLKLMEYKWGAYRVRLSEQGDIDQHSDLIKSLLKRSYDKHWRRSE